MSTFTYSSAFNLSESPFNSLFNSSSSPFVASDEDTDEACSICLEPFTLHDPSTVTSCKHEYHLHCIIEWSQRSKDCPICLQLFVLRDPASQELLSAVEKERMLKTRNRSLSSPISSHQSHDDFLSEEEESQFGSFDEQFLRQLTEAAHRRCFLRRRETQIPSSLVSPIDTNPGLSLGSMIPSPVSGHSSVPAYSNSALRCRHTHNQVQIVAFRFSGVVSIKNCVHGDGLRNHMYFIMQLLLGECSSLKTGCNLTSTYLPYSHLFLVPVIRFSPGRSPSRSSQSPDPAETSSLPEAIKSKLAAASARYKESISKSKQGLKEKLLARNNSVKELRKGVHREMNAGIAGVARMIERLDLASKRFGGFANVSTSTTSASGFNFSFKGKHVEANSKSNKTGDETESYNLQVSESHNNNGL